MSRRRVVVTGAGCVTPLGPDLPRTWDGLLAGRSGAGPITRFDASGLGTRFACEVSDFDPSRHLTPREVRRSDPFAQYLLAAAAEAVAASGIALDRLAPERTACFVGTGIGGIGEIEAGCRTLAAGGPGRVRPLTMPRLMPNAAAALCALRFGIRGPCLTLAATCASGSDAIGQGLKAIRHGEADAVLAGGAEASITPLVMAGFGALGALSTRNDDPAGACRPFDADRGGFVMGEGAGAVVLEERDRALARGAPVVAELLGYGAADDAHHLTAPPSDGAGAVRALRWALADAGIDAGRVAYVNAHGTGTRLNDPAETRAMKTAFGAHAERLAVSSSKSMLGHLMGAAGAVELVVTALAVRHGVVPPTINLERPDPECDLDFVPRVAREIPVPVALTSAFGFGGHTSCLVVGRA